MQSFNINYNLYEMILERFKLQKNLKLALTASNLNIRILAIIKKAVQKLKDKVKQRKLMANCDDENNDDDNNVKPTSK